MEIASLLSVALLALMLPVWLVLMREDLHFGFEFASNASGAEFRGRPTTKKASEIARKKKFLDRLTPTISLVLRSTLARVALASVGLLVAFLICTSGLYLARFGPQFDIEDARPVADRVLFQTVNTVAFDSAGMFMSATFEPATSLGRATLWAYSVVLVIIFLTTIRNTLVVLFVALACQFFPVRMTELLTLKDKSPWALKPRLLTLAFRLVVR